MLLGIGPNDTQAQAEKLAVKSAAAGLCRRGREDEFEPGRRGRGPAGGLQFTLYADIKSRRPGFTKAAPPAVAIPLYETFLDLCRARGFQVEHGAFGADMAVQSVNDGPVTIWMDTETL